MKVKIKYRFKKRLKRCPICRENKIKLQEYHISYSPEKKLKACRDCNRLEYVLRVRPEIIKRIVWLHKKYPEKIIKN